MRKRYGACGTTIVVQGKLYTDSFIHRVLLLICRYASFNLVKYDKLNRALSVLQPSKWYVMRDDEEEILSMWYYNSATIENLYRFIHTSCIIVNV
jgi:hypothetical protein